MPQNQSSAHRSRPPGAGHPAPRAAVMTPAPGTPMSSASARATDSWIEVSSQPSTSSVSSNTDHEVVTTGLRVQGPTRPEDAALQAAHRRRALLMNQPLRHYMADRASGASSQEEYEESESESDHVEALASSSEALPPSTARTASLRRAPSATSADDEQDDDDDDVDENEDGSGDDIATALGTGVADTFTPQPNAFSHPPATSRRGSGSHFAPRPAARHSSQRHSYPARHGHAPYPYSASHQADHDAALRASLSTLLSCAAAARGLPKASSSARPAQPSARIEPRSLRMVPESALTGGSAKPRSSSQSSTGRRHKRKSSSRSGSHERSRSTKKERLLALEEGPVSPTLMTWVVSAGVLVLVSALSFSAGYTLGREAGHVEAGLAAAPADAASCSQDAARGLRRLRWSTAANIAVGV